MPTITDKFAKSAPNASTLLSGDHTSAVTTLLFTSPISLPTTTPSWVTLFVTDASGNVTSYESVKGIYVSGSNSLTNCIRGSEGTQQAWPANSKVYASVTAGANNDFVDGILTEHNPNGTHGNITATGLTVTGSTSLVGSFDGWVGANEAWTFASATTINVPSDATTKYDVGDYIKLTQSATVKYFMVAGVSTTLLTVAGLAGATVANSAISANSYSKVRNPHGNGTAGVPFNPYKFSVFRTAAWTTGTISVVLFDTKAYDTSSNVDIVTNKGRFTAPIAGYYHFSSVVTSNIASGGGVLIALAKNGSVVKQNSYVNGASTTQVGIPIAGDLQLAANDYVEVEYQGSTSTGGVGANNTYFDGFLVSAV